MAEKLRDTVKRLVVEDDGMEMVEWSIVGVVFALAGAVLWTTLNQDVKTAMDQLGSCVSSGNCDSGGGTPPGQ